MPSTMSQQVAPVDDTSGVVTQLEALSAQIEENKRQLVLLHQKLDATIAWIGHLASDKSPAKAEVKAKAEDEHTHQAKAQAKADKHHAKD